MRRLRAALLALPALSALPALLFVGALGCSRDHAAPAPAPGAAPTSAPAATPTSAAPAAPTADPNLAADQNEYVEDVMAFTSTTREQVRARMKLGSEPLKDEWNAWEKQGPMTPARIAAFYKQTKNYIYELAEWHLFVPGKRESDLALVEDMRRKRPKNILDFGGGVGLMAIPLARAGFDVTLADLDGTSLDFAAFRAKRHDIKLKIWKSDVEPAPPDATYDVILALDVLEHLPKDVLRSVVDKLVALKHAGTEIVMSAPFGRTAVHPMHMDADEDTRRQVERLKTEVPAR
ncbi:MAG TPA: class I SAM-dependent methyltransferase [Kofleriaceae bacterium]|nr:class I SAM-dependent methyltransferase [Kofleriaceae bacterium]